MRGTSLKAPHRGRNDRQTAIEQGILGVSSLYAPLVKA